MFTRGLLFSAWALLGAVLSYGVVYLVSGIGFAIVAACALAGLALPAAGGSRWPEALGLAAGPGILLLVAAGAGSDATLGVVGAAIVTTATVAYAMVGRARCVRPGLER